MRKKHYNKYIERDQRQLVSCLLPFPDGPRFPHFQAHFIMRLGLAPHPQAPLLTVLHLTSHFCLLAAAFRCWGLTFIEE